MIKPFFLVVMSITANTLYSFSQLVYMKEYNDLSVTFPARPSSFSLATDGNYYIAATGNDFNSTNEGLFIIKINPQGDTLWNKLYQVTPDAHVPRTILSTPDSGCIIGGDNFILKIDKDGNSLWAKNNFNLSVISIARSAAGYMLAAVDLPVNISGSCCSYILKITEHGHLYDAFRRTVNGPTGNGKSDIYQISTLRNGNYLISTSSFSHTTPSADIFVTDSALHCYAIITGEGTNSRSIQTSDGSLIMIYKSHYGPSIVKYDSTGNKTWEKTFLNDFIPTSIDTLYNGGVIIAGKISGTSRTVISKINNNGILQSTYATCCIDTPVVHSTSDGGFATIAMDSITFSSIQFYKADTTTGCMPLSYDSLDNFPQTPTSYFPMSFYPYDFGGFPITMSNVTTISSNGGQMGIICTTTGIEKARPYSDFKIYPNPAYYQINIEFPNPLLNVDALIISDLTGKVLMKFTKPFSEVEIDISHLPGGIYVASIISSTHFNFQKFVIIENKE